MIGEFLQDNKNDIRIGSKLHYRVLSIIVFFIITFIVSMMLGRYELKPSEIWYLLTDFHLKIFSLETIRPEALVFYNVRIPRIILAATVGAVLSGTGVLFQGIFKNPLASPDILGVTSGCCFGAALGILLPINSPYIIQFCAFVFGMLSILMTYGMAKTSRNHSIIMLVLGGMVISAFFSAALSFIKYVSDPYEQLPAIVFWIMGGFHRSSWKNVSILLVSVVPCLIFLSLFSWKLNILSLGDEEAYALGINVKKVRFLLLVVSSFMVASCVSVSGTVSWVALVIPHITRLLIGSNHRYTFPISLLIGASFTLLLDDIARSLTTSEIPISILTAAIGAPVFGFLLLKRRSIW